MCPNCGLPLAANHSEHGNHYLGCTYCGCVYQLVPVTGQQIEVENLEAVRQMQKCERVQG